MLISCGIAILMVPESHSYFTFERITLYVLEEVTVYFTLL